MKRKHWHIHACTPWSKDCSMRGVRLNIRTPWRFIYIALTPEAKVADRDGKWHWIVVDKYH